MQLSDSIKMTRQKAFLSQEEFAKELGVSFATINRWETGKSRPSIKAMKNLDDYCKKNNIQFDVTEYIFEK